MRKLLLALTFILVSDLAFGQCTGIFQPNAVCGNPGAAASPPRATGIASLGIPPNTYVTTAHGMVCNGSTDDTPAFNALLTTVNGAGGGTIYVAGRCLINGAVVFPNDGFKQSPIRITGGGNSPTFSSTNVSPSILDLRFNATTGKLDTRAHGLVQIDNVVLMDGGTSCAPFIFTTFTTLKVHDVYFYGTQSGLNACNDAFVFGGDGSTSGMQATSPFQGYGTIIRDNFFDKIRAGAVYNAQANGIVFNTNTFHTTTGNGTTTAISAATNANPARITVTGHGYVPNSIMNITMVGFTGSWVTLNGRHPILVIDANTLEVIGFNSLAFGAMTGSPGFYTGAAIELNGNAVNGGAQGNIFYGNLVEMTNYPIFANLRVASAITFFQNNFFDISGFNSAYFKISDTAATVIGDVPMWDYGGLQHDIPNGVGGVSNYIGLGTTVTGQYRFTTVMETLRGYFNSTLTTVGDATINGVTVGLGGGQNVTNNAFGSAALIANTTGTGNTAVGSEALEHNTQGTNNTAVGNAALITMTVGTDNTAIGKNTLLSATNDCCNVAIGTQALTTANVSDHNTAVGYQSLFTMGTSSANTAIGATAGRDITVGSGNTLIGNNTGRGITTGTTNTIIGAEVTGLASNLSQNIILADGGGNIRAQHDATNWSMTARVAADSFAMPATGVDLFLTRSAAATLQQGAADAASPVAQTTQVQSVVAGTSNTAGTNWTINGSRGTGTGVGGNIIFQNAPAGGSGSTQNTLIQTRVYDQLGHIRVGNDTAPALTSCGTNPSIIGTDEAAEVTMGTGTPTGCVITFNRAYANAPLCVLNWQATPLASQSWTVSASAITTVQTATSSNKLNYICRARNGG